MAIYEQYGADAQMLAHADDPRADRAKVCTITISLYERILQLPPDKASELIRTMATMKRGHSPFAGKRGRLMPLSYADRILKVNHAGEHGAVNIYRGQRLVCFWRDAQLKRELEEFRAHEERHRAIFAAELERRGVRRCRSYWLCGAGGLLLGLTTGICGPRVDRGGDGGRGTRGIAPPRNAAA